MKNYNYDDKVGFYPKDWDCSRFKDFAVLQRGKDLTDNDVILGKYPVVKSNGVDIFHCDYFVEPPGVVTGRSGTIGKAFYLDAPFWAHNTTLYVKDFKGNVPKYIFYLIQRLDFSRYFAGTTVPTLNRNDIHNLRVYIPSDIQEQKAIVVILSKVDEVIDAVENSINAAERLKTSLMQNLLTGKLKPDGTWRSDDELTLTKYGFIPRSWKYCQIIDLIREGYLVGVQDGNHGEAHPMSSEFVSQGIPFVMASDISDGFIDFINCKKLTPERSDKLRIGFSKNGDVLLSHKASVGYTCIVENADPYVMLTPQVTYYRVNPTKLSSQYLRLFFQTYPFQCYLEGLAKQSTRNYIGITNQKKMWIYIPDDIKIQRSVSEPIIRVDIQIQNKRSKIQSLKTLKKSLMQNLLTGKVRVDIEKINRLLEEG